MSRTNFDRIKDMSVEEMSEFLIEVHCTKTTPCMIGESVCKWEDYPTYDKGCKDCFREWLEMEVEE